MHGCARPQCRTEVPLDHRVHRLALPTLVIQRGITLLGKTTVHATPQRLVPRRTGERRSAGARRDDRTGSDKGDAHRLGAVSSETMCAPLVFPALISRPL